MNKLIKSIIIKLDTNETLEFPIKNPNYLLADFFKEAKAIRYKFINYASTQKYKPSLNEYLPIGKSTQAYINLRTAGMYTPNGISYGSLQLLISNYKNYSELDNIVQITLSNNNILPFSKFIDLIKITYEPRLMDGSRLFTLHSTKSYEFLMLINPPNVLISSEQIDIRIQII